MANTNATINGTLITQRALKTLLVRFPILLAVTASLSSEAVKYNQQVMAQVVTATTAADWDTTNGYAPIDRVQVDVPVTINKHKHHTYVIDDQERSSTDINLIQRYADTAAHALGKALVDDLMALVNAANYTNKTIVAAAAFNRSAVVDIQMALNGRFVSPLDRFMVVQSAYYGNLEKDVDVVRRDASGADTINSGILPDVHGFNVSEYAALPNNDTTLQGFAGNREGLVFATRLPQEPEVSNLPGTIQVVTEPNTGFSVQLRQWYDMKAGKEYRTITFMYGVAKGVTNNIQRITTA